MINNQVIIADVSFWQDDDETPYKIDFSIMRSHGVDGAILRAGQNTWYDEDYIDYAANADRIGFPRGAYWFYDSRSNPIHQADKFADLIEVTGFPKLGIWGDYEERYGGPYGGEKNFKAFMDRLKERFPGKLIGVYTAYYYWLEKTTATFRANFKDYPLWIAHYRVSKPLIPSPWSDYLFWQYTDTGDGKKLGVESHELDLNLYRRGFEEYKSYFKLGDLNHPNITDSYAEEGMFEVWSESYTMSLRFLNTVNSGVKEYIPRGTKMIADRVESPASGGLAGDKWAHITEINGQPKDGWVAIVHNGVKYCEHKQLTAQRHVVEVYIDGVLEYKKELG